MSYALCVLCLIHACSLITHVYRSRLLSLFFFFNVPATTEIYTLSLHDALPICTFLREGPRLPQAQIEAQIEAMERSADRKSTRLNSSHVSISYAVFCLKKKKKYQKT